MQSTHQIKKRRTSGSSSGESSLSEMPPDLSIETYHLIPEIDKGVSKWCQGVDFKFDKPFELSDIIESVFGHAVKLITSGRSTKYDNGHLNGNKNRYLSGYWFSDIAEIAQKLCSGDGTFPTRGHTMTATSLHLDSTIDKANLNTKALEHSSFDISKNRVRNDANSLTNLSRRHHEGLINAATDVERAFRSGLNSETYSNVADFIGRYKGATDEEKAAFLIRKTLEDTLGPTPGYSWVAAVEPDITKEPNISYRVAVALTKDTPSATPSQNCKTLSEHGASTLTKYVEDAMVQVNHLRAKEFRGMVRDGTWESFLAKDGNPQRTSLDLLNMLSRLSSNKGLTERDKNKERHTIPEDFPPGNTLVMPDTIHGSYRRSIEDIKSGSKGPNKRYLGTKSFALDNRIPMDREFLREHDILKDAWMYQYSIDNPSGQSRESEDIASYLLSDSKEHNSNRRDDIISYLAQDAVRDIRHDRTQRKKQSTA